jgi:hypothetical protein
MTPNEELIAMWEELRGVGISAKFITAMTGVKYVNIWNRSSGKVGGELPYTKVDKIKELHSDIMAIVDKNN